MALIEVEGLSVSFAGLHALADATFTVEAGKICAVIGPNGAGKTTLFNAISGYVRPTSGTVKLDGRLISSLPAHKVAAAGLRRTFQNGGVFPSLTVLENVLCGLHQSTNSSLFGMALALPRSRAAEADATEASRAMLRQLGIADLADRPALDLSFGQQRMVEIARALISKPRILLLDEPAVGLSSSERMELEQALRSLAADGVGILLVEHVLDLVMSISDRIVVLNYGRVIAQGPPEEVRNDPLVLEAYLGHE